MAQSRVHMTAGSARVPEVLVERALVDEDELQQRYSLAVKVGMHDGMFTCGHAWSVERSAHGEAA